MCQDGEESDLLEIRSLAAGIRPAQQLKGVRRVQASVIGYDLLTVPLIQYRMATTFDGE